MTSALAFKARVDPLACVLHHLHATESSDSPLVRYQLCRLGFLSRNLVFRKLLAARSSTVLGELSFFQNSLETLLFEVEQTLLLQLITKISQL